MYEIIRKTQAKPDYEIYMKISYFLYAKKQWWYDLYPQKKQEMLVRFFSDKHPGWKFTGQSAAAIYDIPRSDKWDTGSVHIQVDNCRTKADAVIIHNTQHKSSDNYMENIRLDDIESTLYTLSFTDSLESLIVSIEHCLWNKYTTKRALINIIQHRKWSKDIQKFAKAVMLSSTGSESPLESKVKVAIHNAGILEPIQQYPIDNYRIDMFWPEYNLIYEIDGMVKYSLKESAFIDEKKREDDLREQGYEFLRTTDEELKSGVLIRKLKNKIITILKNKKYCQSCKTELVI
jgi:very-short-patch-repair endonuclease